MLKSWDSLNGAIVDLARVEGRFVYLGWVVCWVVGVFIWVVLYFIFYYSNYKI